MKEENDNIRFLSVISYISVLFVVGHFSVEKNNPDLRFHKYQGGVMFAFFSFFYLLDLLIYFLLSFSPELQTMIVFLITGALLIANCFMSALGIRYALRFEQRLIPFIGPVAVSLRKAADRRINR